MLEYVTVEVQIEQLQIDFIEFWVQRRSAIEMYLLNLLSSSFLIKFLKLVWFLDSFKVLDQDLPDPASRDPRIRGREGL